MQNIRKYLSAISRALCLVVLIASCSRTETPAGPSEAAPTTEESLLGVYQGMTPAASGPGMEMTVYLYPGNRAFRKMVYLKTPNEAWFDTGTWKFAENTLTVVYDGDQGTDAFGPEGTRLYLLDADGKKLGTDIPNIFLYRLTD